MNQTAKRSLVGLPKRRRMRKERERTAKKQDIIAAARVVFARKGYKNATLDEIAERAEFAKGTLYNYFRSKEEIFEHILTSRLDEMVGFTQTALKGEGTIRDKFQRFSLDMMEFYKANEDFLMIVSREMNRMMIEKDHKGMAEMHKRVDKMTMMLASVLKGDIRQRKIINEDPHSLAHVFISLIHARSIRRFIEEDGLQSIDVKKEAAFLVRLFFEGAAV